MFQAGSQSVELRARFSLNRDSGAAKSRPGHSRAEVHGSEAHAARSAAVRSGVDGRDDAALDPQIRSGNLRLADLSLHLSLEDPLFMGSPRMLQRLQFFSEIE